MIVSKNIRISKIWAWSGHHAIWLTAMSALIAYLYRNHIISLQLPWLPISVIGTAVAFYVGFKNNSAYDRMWEARKVWGAIVNSSRSWGMYVDGFITNQFAKDALRDDELKAIKTRLTYRHIAWLYALRKQLLKVVSWEHANQSGLIGRSAKIYREQFGIGLVVDEVNDAELNKYLDTKEYKEVTAKANPATQIMVEQSRDLTLLREKGFIDDFRHMEMEKMLSDFYIQQGKCERIKKFPLPRQYANMSRLFVAIFIILFPFSMIPELMSLGGWGIWLSIPITALVGWVYVMMEIVGDYTENPFQGMANDIPMLSLCRTIEIDLREMLGETDLPEAIEPKNDILM